MPLIIITDVAHLCIIQNVAILSTIDNSACFSGYIYIPIELRIPVRRGMCENGVGLFSGSVMESLCVAIQMTKSPTESLAQFLPCPFSINLCCKDLHKTKESMIRTEIVVNKTRFKITLMTICVSHIFTFYL